MMQGPPEPAAPPAPDQRPHQKELDRLLKSVMALDRGRLLPLIFRPELCQLLSLPSAAPILLSQLDKEFSDVRRLGDYLLEVMFSVLIRVTHFEFQKFPDSAMGRRQAGYQVAIRLKHDIPVDSLVLNLSHPPGQRRTFHKERFALGALSEVGWINVSIPRLVGEWPDKTDSPMAEMLRALVRAHLDQRALRDLLDRLLDLGLTQG